MVADARPYAVQWVESDGFSRYVPFGTQKEAEIEFAYRVRRGTGVISEINLLKDGSPLFTRKGPDLSVVG